MKVDRYPFTNSDACRGVAFAAVTAPLDIAQIEITGRYPEAGWAMNEVSHEMVYVQRGLGFLALKNGETTQLKEGDAVHVPAGEWFAWGGDMTLTMACHPPFSIEQYNTEEDDAV